MPAITRGRIRPARQDATHNPLVCALVTAALATTFWVGVVWAAQRIMN